MTCQAHTTLGTPSSFIPSTSSALCCCYTFHLMDCTPPLTAAALTSVYHANTLPADADPGAFYPTVCYVFVCPSAPCQLRFFSYFLTNHRLGRGLPLAFYPVIHPKDVHTSPFPLPPPMADNGTSISNATMPIRDARPLREAARWRSCAR